MLERPSFYWGIGIENCWMAEHDETNRPPHRLLDVFLQMQHYTMWREDLDKAAELGVNALRYGVPWYRANPKPGEYDWKWLDRSLDYLVNNLGIVPIIDLIHYGTPLWMTNGVVNHAYAERFAEYASAFARHYRGLIDHYTPQNEPQVTATFAGYRAYWPPYLAGVDGWAKVGLSVAKGMILVSQALRAEVPGAVLISADCLVSPEPSEVEAEFGVTPDPASRSEFDYQARSFPTCLAYGKLRPDSPFWKAMIVAGATEAQLEWLRANAQLPDVVGCNYYPECFADPAIGAEAGLAKGAAELRKRLLDTYEFWGKPVYLTETSDGYDDEQKAAWMHAAYGVIADLKAKGVPIVGMNWWPLFETEQWDYRDTTKTVLESITHGVWNNGLYLVREQFDGTLARVRTASADTFRDLIRASTAR